MFFDDYSELPPILASMVYLTSEEVAVEPGILAETAALDGTVQKESIENSSARAECDSISAKQSARTVLDMTRKACETDDSMRSIIEAKTTGARRLFHAIIIHHRMTELKDVTIVDGFALMIC
jgi:hypothetical protein